MKVGKNKRFFQVAASLVTVLALFVGFFTYKIQRDYLVSKGLPVPNVITSLFNQDNSNENVRLGELSANQLMQKLIDACSNRVSTIEVYQSIPNAQLNNINFERFDQYISALRKATKQSELSFWPMSSDERIETQKTIANITADLSELTEKAGYYWVKPLSGSSSAKLPILLAKNSEGSYSFSGAWVRSCLAIYNYSKLYFSTISNEDSSSLSAIVTSGSDAQQVRELKANRTLNFYKQVMFGPVDSYEILSWRMDLMIFRQKILPQYNGKTNANYINRYDALDAGLGPQESNTRLVYVIATAANEYQVRDLIPQDFSEEDFQVRLGNQEILKPGDFVSSDSLVAAFGEILSMQETKTSASLGNSSYTLLFNNVHLILKNVSYSDTKNFSAVIDKITLLSPDYQIAETGIHLGNRVDDLLKAYPFLDLYAYVAVDQNGKYFCNYVIREGEIKAIVVGLLSGSRSELGNLFSRDLLNTSEGIPTPAPTLSPTPTPSPSPTPTPSPSPVPTTSSTTLAE